MTQLLAVMGRMNRIKFRDQVIRPLFDAGWLEMTLRDGMQGYRTTDAGREALAAIEAGVERGRYPMPGIASRGKIGMVRSSGGAWPGG